MKTNIFTKAVVFILMISLVISFACGCAYAPTYAGDEALTDEEKDLFIKWDNVIRTQNTEIKSIEYYQSPIWSSISGSEIVKYNTEDKDVISKFCDELNKSNLTFEKLVYTDQETFEKYGSCNEPIEITIKTNDDDKYLMVSICIDGSVYLRLKGHYEDYVISEDYCGCFYRSKNKVSYDEIFDIFKNK